MKNVLKESMSSDSVTENSKYIHLLTKISNELFRITTEMHIMSKIEQGFNMDIMYVKIWKVSKFEIS